MTERDAAAFRPATAADDHRRALVVLAVAALLGAVAAEGAIIVSGLAMRYLVAMVAAAAGIVALPLLGSRQRARDAMVAAIAFGSSIGLSISFLHRMEIPGRFASFWAGAEGVTVSLCLLGTAGYIAMGVFEHWFYGIRRPVRVYHPLLWPSVAFIVAGLLSLMNATDIPLSILEEVRLLCLLVVLLVVMNFTTHELGVYLSVLAGSVILEAACASLQFVTGRSLGLSVFGEAAPIMTNINFKMIARPTGTIGDPNILSYFFEITLPVMLAMFFVAANRMERLFYLIATAAGLGGTILTLSRAAWATIPVTCGFIMLTVYGRRLLTLRAALFGIIALAILAAAIVYIYPLLATRLFGNDAGSMAERLPLDRAALSVISQFPLFGVGLNNFAITFTHYDTTSFSRIRLDFKDAMVAVDYVVHNLHLLVWTEVGTVGFLAFLWFFLSAFITAARLGHAGSRSRALAFGICAGLFAHMLHGLVDPGFKMNLTISQLINAQIGLVGCIALAERRAVRQGRRGGFASPSTPTKGGALRTLHL